MISIPITGAASAAVALAQDAIEADQGLTLAKLVSNIPHDLSALVVYALLLGSTALVWWAGRSRTPRDGRTEPPR